MRIMGTTARNPHRYGQPKQCTWCGKWYTHLGLPRHWGKCPKRKVETP